MLSICASVGEERIFREILVFHSDFGCIEGGGGEHPLAQMDNIFPAAFLI